MSSKTTNNQITYNGKPPPCGIYCGTCPYFTRSKNKCKGAETHCKVKRCKGIYVCCVEKKGLDFCYQCKSYPCARFKTFSETWLKYGQDLMRNQEIIKESGSFEFINKMQNNEKSR